ncbi:MAG TPA: DUF1999 family protein, partial [Deinococcales bacterium]|nr:DUF1999 family protein [Deinococcales bacterium]
MICRPPEEADFAAMQALEGELLRVEEPRFDSLALRERDARTRTTVPSLLFFARSGHSFVATSRPGRDGTSALYGYVLAQAVWQGDRAVVLVAALAAHPDAPGGT